MRRNCRREIREGALGERLEEGHFASKRKLAVIGSVLLRFAFERDFAAAIMLS